MAARRRAVRRAEGPPRIALKTDKLPPKAGNTNLDYHALPDLAVQAQHKSPLDNLRRFIEGFDGSVIFSVESEGRRETLQDLLGRIKLAPALIQRLDQVETAGRYMMVGAAEHGFLDGLRQRALICESDLLGERVSRRRQDNRRTINTDTLIRNPRSSIPASRWCIWSTASAATSA